MQRGEYRADRSAAEPDLDPRIHDALTDLHAYALLLDSEQEQLGVRIEQLALAKSTSSESHELAERRASMAEELEALRGTIAALRDQARHGDGIPAAPA